MALIATEAKRLSNVVKQELWAEAGYCRAVLTASADVVPGSVMESGGLVVGVSMEEAASGSNVLALVKGPAIVSKGGLVLGAIAAQDVYDALEAVGIAVNDAV